MVLSIVRDAVHIKMKLKNESPLISVPEFCYAAGLGCRIMGVIETDKNALQNEEVFGNLKEQVQQLARGSESFANIPNGDRLKSLIVGCRIRGEMSEEARRLFDMGYDGK